MEKSVFILMATYNGGKYLEEQLDSIIEQTYNNWRLIVRDDNSSDNTKSILRAYADRDSRITVIFGGTRLGAAENFGYLLTKYGNDGYIMFSDQDDVWIKDKINVSLNEMRRTEQELGEKKPILVYTDKINADRNLNVVRFHDYEYKDDLISILAQNHIWGCTMLLNHALVKKVKSIPKEAQNADYWVALMSVCFGTIRHINKKTMFYRLHDNNTTGGINNFSMKYKLSNWNHGNADIADSITQNIFFAQNYKDGCEKKRILDLYIDVFKAKGFLRVIKAAALGLKRDHFLATMRYYLVLLKYDLGY